MEYKYLLQFIVMLIVVGLLVGVGVLSLNYVGDAARESNIITNESFTVPAQNAKVSLSNGNITSFTQIINSTGAVWDASNYSVDLTAGTINNTGNAGSCTSGDTCYASYKYDDYNTVTKTVTTASATAIGEVSTNWLSLIVTIGILAIIIGLVITGFYMYYERK